MLARITAYLLLVGVLAYEYLEKSPDRQPSTAHRNVASAWLARVQAYMVVEPTVTLGAHDRSVVRPDTVVSPASRSLECPDGRYRHNGPISLLSLCEGDRVELDYHSVGCFHDTHHRIALKPVDGGRLATRVFGPPAHPDGHFVRERVLTHAQAVGLDTWLATHRHRAGFGGCTSMTELVVSLYVASRLMARETYHDNRCQFDAAAGTLPVRLLAFVPVGEPLPGW